MNKRQREKSRKKSRVDKAEVKLWLPRLPLHAEGLFLVYPFQVVDKNIN